jgi:uncharacterized protein YkwD
MRGRPALIVLLALAPTVLAASGLPEAAGAGARSRATARPRAARARSTARARSSAHTKRAVGPPVDRRGPADRLLELINGDRAAAGLAPLVVRPDLGAIAAGFSGRLAQEGGLHHNQDLFSPASLTRLGVTKLGENVGVSPSAEGAHRAFMASPHHRSNILDPGFGSVGISVTAAGSGALWVVEDFASPSRSRGR